MKRYLLWSAFAAALAIPNWARGGAIEVPMQSAAAAGQADAFTAQADDPSAIFYNPSGLTQIKGTEVSAGAFYLQPEFHLRSNTPGDNVDMNLSTILPHIYLESDLGTKNFRVGIGIDNTFGINEDYGVSSPLAPLVNKAQLSIMNIAPTFAYKLNDQISAGIAMNVYYGSMYLTRELGAPEPEFHYRGQDVEFGVTPGIMWHIDDHNTVAAYYRSPFTMTFAGNATVKAGSTALAGPSRAYGTLDFPQSIGVGYAYRPCDKATLEVDLIWTDWQQVRAFYFTSSNPAFNGQNLPANWKSGLTARLGGAYKLDQHWTIRAGYAYSQNSVPDSTFSPLVPDSNYHLFALGGGYSTKQWSFDLAAEYIFRENRHITGSVDSPLVDGTWSNQMFGLMATLTLKM